MNMRYTIVPKISVIIPVYNKGKYLSCCLESVIKQTLQDIEIICINDGSKDNSLDILNDYAQKDSRIIVVDQENHGVSYSRNKGLEIAKGKYVHFFDADDYYYKDYALEKIFTTMEDDNSDVALFAIIDDFGGQLKNHHTVKKIERCYADSTSFQMLSLCTGMAYRVVKKSFLDENKIKFDSDISIGEDSIASLLLHFCEPKYSIINDIFYAYKKGTGGLTTQNINYIQELLKTVKVLENNELYKKQPDSSKEYIINNWFYTCFSLWKNACNKKFKSKYKKDIAIMLKYFETIYNEKFLAKLKYYPLLKNIVKFKIFAIDEIDNGKRKVVTLFNLIKIKVKNKKKKKKKTEKEKEKEKEKAIEIYSVSYAKPASTYKTLVCPIGFGHSGSGAFLDYISEFSNATTMGYRDPGFSGYVNDSRVPEFDIFKVAGGVMDMEKAFNYPNYYNDSLCIKMFLHIAEYFYRKGGIYNDYFWQITQDFIDKITDMKIPTDTGFEGLFFLKFKNAWKRYKNLNSPMFIDNENGQQYIYYLKALSVPEYRKIAHEYITKFLNSIESKEFLVCDQLLTTSAPDIERKLEYFGDFKIVCVYRDPRDVYVTGVIKNEQWIPKDPADFVKWYNIRGVSAYVHAPKHPNMIVIRFEDLVLNYEETTEKINEFIGLNEQDHIHKREYFNPDISSENVGLYKTFENQKTIKYIEENLKEYCYVEGGISLNA